MEKPEQVFAYNGDIITLKILETSSAVAEQNALMISRKAFCPETATFIETSSGQYIIPSSKSKFQFVCISCVADFRTGIIVPCILLRASKRKSSSPSRLVLLLLHTITEVEVFLKIKVDTETIEDVRVTDGPTVLWKQQEKLFYVSSLTAGVLTAPIDISAILWTGTVEEGTCILCIKAKRLDADHVTSTYLPNRTLQGNEFVWFCTDNKKTMSGSCLVPHAYTSVIRCLHVCRMNDVNGSYETSAIGASNKQLIYFQNGVPKQVFQLPFENPSKLQIAYASRGEMLCLVSFASGEACAWKDGWKAAATWQHVENILVDDFVGRGYDQMLLLFKEDPSTPPGLQPFRLTDCGDIDYPAEHSDDKVTENQFQENQLLIIQTLEARLQTSMLSLEELQNHLEVQDRVLKSSCDALINMSMGKETSVRSAKQENLVSLLDDDEEDYLNSSTTETCSSSVDSEGFVDKIWHRVVDDFLVVGVKLKSSVDISLSDIGLSLIMDQEIASPSQVTKCQTNVLKLAISPSLAFNTGCPCEPTAKKQRVDCHSKDSLSWNCSHRPCPPSYQNDLEHTVTAVTEMSSLLALNNTSCVLLLHTRRKNPPDGLVRSENLTVPCGTVSLRLEDVLKGKHTVNVFENCQAFKSLEDIFAVLSAFHRCLLHIFSPDCTLTSVRPWLLEEMKGESLTHMPDVMVCTRPGSLRGTLFIWNPKNPCDGTLTVFYRNDAAILQCLYSLKSVIPATCVVNVMRPGVRKSLAADLARSLEEELLALRNLASSAANEVENNLTLRCEQANNSTNTTDTSSDTKEHVQKYRESLKTEQMQVKLGDQLTTSSELYRHNMLKVAEMQIKCDELACRMAQL